MSISPIMTLYREFAVKYRQAGDMTFEEEVTSGLLEECKVLEKRMMAIPSASAQDLAAKIIAETRYNDFCLSEPGEGGVYNEILALLEDHEHPDAKLIELGQQFEAVKNEARKLEVEWKRSRVAFEKACEEAGIPEDAAGYYASRSIARRTGYDKAYNAFSKEHSRAIKLARAIHRAKAATLEGYAVKVAAIAFDQSDFEVSDPVPSDVAERELYRLAREMAKTVKAKPVLPAPSLLDSLIEAHSKAKEAYENAAPDQAGDPLWNAYYAAELAILKHPCRTIEEVRTKARFFLEDTGAYDTLRRCCEKDEETLMPFLRSLLGEARS